MRYEVHIHETDESAQSRSGGRHYHRWTTITPRAIGLEDAKHIADEQDTHATVQVAHSAETVHDNGRKPLPYDARRATVVIVPRGRARGSRAPTAPREKLPRIVQYLESVESDTCPHCGASGRVVHRFRTEDGRELGAMSGCIKLFPKSPIIDEDLRLRKKAGDYASRGWDLTASDKIIADTIDAFYSQQIDEASALRRIKAEKATAAARRRARGRR